jgi:hypothetical protein
MRIGGKANSHTSGPPGFHRPYAGGNQNQEQISILYLELRVQLE